eukprot:CAMPEP_0113884764 /NCGR_PEP_ID=MMETSP0780_2-20120614/10475_1 /TAXON_ID=652834 /ORGANISM="Palpitomonas bilix" /LENGTH=36 /DNA_ID=CAMNT_0000872493 /DNA_START=597 /DNA_END=707 /DNA_ORIENTATION=+ /assembly_acc=CAM_ASM_000599
MAILERRKDEGERKKEGRGKRRGGRRKREKEGAVAV